MTNISTASGITTFTTATKALDKTIKYSVVATMTNDGSGQTASKSAIITPVFFTLDFGSGGKSIGIGQAAKDGITGSGQLDIAMKTNLTSDSTIGGCTVLKSVPANAVFTDTNTTYSAGTGLSLSGTKFSVPYEAKSLGTNAWIKRFGNVVTLYLDGYKPGKAIANKDSLPIAVPEGFCPAHDMWCLLNALGIGDYGKRFKIKTGGGIEYRGNVTLDKDTAYYFTATWVI